MKLKIILIAGGIALAGLGAAGAVTLSDDHRAGIAGRSDNVLMLAGHRHGWGKRHRMLHALCGEARDERIDTAIALAENFMAFTPEQQAAWDRLTATVRQGSETVDETCEATEPLHAERTLPAKLALAEAAARTAATVLGEVRPAFDDWYATLTEEQRKALDGLLRHRHRSRRG